LLAQKVLLVERKVTDIIRNLPGSERNALQLRLLAGIWSRYKRRGHGVDTGLTGARLARVVCAGKCRDQWPIALRMETSVEETEDGAIRNSSPATRH